jgi:hypothetical protein
MDRVITNLVTVQKGISPVSSAGFYLPETGHQIEGSTKPAIFEIRNSVIKAAIHSVIIGETNRGLCLSRPNPSPLHISISD